MGGWGSGKRWGARDTTDGYLRLDVRYMERHNLLGAGYSGRMNWTRNGENHASINFTAQADCITLSYRSRQRGDEWESLEYPVRLERTACHYGGSRTWFLCPARGCVRRVAILYGGRIFACRRCYGLAYESQNEKPGDRATSKAWELLKRLKCDHIMCIFDTDPPKPKGMHQRTYQKLARQYEVARYKSLSSGPAGAMDLL